MFGDMTGSCSWIGRHVFIDLYADCETDVRKISVFFYIFNSIQT
jgi:hypothetical protein